jgi:hypothetical protein
MKIEAPDASRGSKKQKTAAEALEIGLVAIKDGLVSLGNSLAAPPPPSAPSIGAPGADGASLTDVLRAIQDQSALMAQLMAHKKEN